MLRRYPPLRVGGAAAAARLSRVCHQEEEEGRWAEAVIFHLTLPAYSSQHVIKLMFKGRRMIPSKIYIYIYISLLTPAVCQPHLGCACSLVGSLDVSAWEQESFVCYTKQKQRERESSTW